MSNISSGSFLPAFNDSISHLINMRHYHSKQFSILFLLFVKSWQLPFLSRNIFGPFCEGCDEMSAGLEIFHSLFHKILLTAEGEEETSVGKAGESLIF
jgi:hypothetical protein